MSSQNIGEFVMGLNINGDISKLEEANKGVKTLDKNAVNTTFSLTKYNNILADVVKTTALLGGASATAFYGLNRFTSNLAMDIIQMQELSRQTGISVIELEKWGRAGERATLGLLKSNDIQQELSKLQKQITDITLYGGSADNFLKIGINPVGKDAFGVLDELKSKIASLKQSGFSSMQITNLIGNIIDPKMIPLLEKTTAEFDKLANHKMLSQSQRYDLMKYQKSWQELGFEFKYIKDLTRSQLAPSIELLNTKLTSWFEQNGTQLIDTIEKIANGFFIMGSGIGNIITLGGSFIENITGMENGVVGLGIALAGVFAIRNPLIAGITAIALLFEDFLVWKNGGGSFFDWQNVVVGINNITDACVALGKVIKEIYGMFSSVTDLFIDSDKFAKNIENHTKTSKELSSNKSLGDIKNDVKGSLFGDNGSLAYGNIVDKFKSFDKTLDKMFDNDILNWGKTITPIIPASLTNNSQANSSSNTFNVSVNVSNTNASASDIGTAVATEMTKAVKDWNVKNNY